MGFALAEHPVRFALGRLAEIGLQPRNQGYGPRGVLGRLLAIVSVVLVVGDSPDGL
jgi:hypothetical protein